MQQIGQVDVSAIEFDEVLLRLRGASKELWLTCAYLGSTVDDTRQPTVVWGKSGILEWLKQAASSTAAANSQESVEVSAAAAAVAAKYAIGGFRGGGSSITNSSSSGGTPAQRSSADSAEPPLVAKPTPAPRPRLVRSSPMAAMAHRPSMASPNTNATTPPDTPTNATTNATTSTYLDERYSAAAAAPQHRPDLATPARSTASLFATNALGEWGTGSSTSTTSSRDVGGYSSMSTAPEDWSFATPPAAHEAQPMASPSSPPRIASIISDADPYSTPQRHPRRRKPEAQPADAYDHFQTPPRQPSKSPASVAWESPLTPDHMPRGASYTPRMTQMPTMPPQAPPAAPTPYVEEIIRAAGAPTSFGQEMMRAASAMGGGGGYVGPYHHPAALLQPEVFATEPYRPTKPSRASFGRGAALTPPDSPARQKGAKLNQMFGGLAMVPTRPAVSHVRVPAGYDSDAGSGGSVDSRSTIVPPFRGLSAANTGYANTEEDVSRAIQRGAQLHSAQVQRTMHHGYQHGGTPPGSSYSGGPPSPPRRHRDDRITELSDSEDKEEMSLGSRIINSVKSAAKKTANIVNANIAKRSSPGRPDGRNHVYTGNQQAMMPYQGQPQQQMQQMQLQALQMQQMQQMQQMHPKLAALHPAQQQQILLQEQMNQNQRRETARWIANLQASGLAPSRVTHDNRGSAPIPQPVAAPMYGGGAAESIYGGNGGSLYMGGSVHGGSTVYDCGDSIYGGASHVGGSVYAMSEYGGGDGAASVRSAGFQQPTVMAGPGHYPLGTTDV